MKIPAKLPDDAIVTRCRECDGEGQCVCDECDGEGTHECPECGHDGDCRECDGAAKWACESCHGFGCTDAARAWEREVAATLIPASIERFLVRIAPHLDAAGLPKIGAQIEDKRVRPVVTIEVRDALEAELGAFLGHNHFTTARARPGHPRDHFTIWRWVGEWSLLIS